MWGPTKAADLRAGLVWGRQRQTAGATRGLGRTRTLTRKGGKGWERPLHPQGERREEGRVPLPEL